MITYNNTLRIDIPIKNLHQRLDAPLSQLGFSLVDDIPGALVYRRGSRLKNYIAMSPKGWHTTIKITSDDSTNEVFNVDYQVNTEGQLPLQKEKDYFEQEFNELLQVMNNQKPSEELNQQAADAKRNNYRIMVRILLFMAILTLILMMCSVNVQSLYH